MVRETLAVKLVSVLMDKFPGVGAHGRTFHKDMAVWNVVVCHCQRCENVMAHSERARVKAARCICPVFLSLHRQRLPCCVLCVGWGGTFRLWGLFLS